MTLKELKQQIDLEEFITANGYYRRRDKWTAKWPVYTNGNETIVIKLPKSQPYKTYKKTNGDYGSIIDFCIGRPELLQGYTGTPQQRTYQFLRDYCPKNRIVPHQPADRVTIDYIFDPAMYKAVTDRTTPIFNYLRKRGITTPTLGSPVFSNIGIFTYTDKFKQVHKNIGFPLYNMDGKIVGAEQHNFGYKKMAPGSDKSNGIWLSNHLPAVDEIVIGEAAIDLLSYHQLFNQNESNVLYISTSGSLTTSELKNILLIIHKMYVANVYLKVTTAFDNDKTGIGYTNKLLLSLLEGKIIFPLNHEKIYQKYEPLTSLRLKHAIEDLTDFRLLDRGNYYTLICPAGETSLKQLNQVIENCINTVWTHIACPQLKDFNEDLQKQRQTTCEISETIKSIHSNKKDSNKQLKFQNMAKISKEQFPVDILEKMGFNVEKLLANEKLCNAIGYGERVGPFNINVTDIFQKRQQVPAKIRLTMKNEIPHFIVEYASAYLNLKKPFWNKNFSEEEQKFLMKYKELGKIVELSINGKTIPGLIGIDEDLNIPHFTPLSAVRVHDHYLEQNIDGKESMILKKGGMVYKENFTDPVTGETFNSVLYWSSTKDKIGFHTPTADLLQLCRKYDEQMTQELIKSNIANQIEQNPVIEQAYQQSQGMDCPF